MIHEQDINEKYKVFSTDVFRSNHGIANEKFLGDKIAGVITSKVCGLDIDDIIDFEIVECLIKHKAHLINEYFKDITELIKENLNEILSLRHEKSLKSDNSYVTSGDLHLEKLLLNYINKKLHNCVIISEESYENKTYHLLPDTHYVIIDPIDGTENFTSGLREWEFKSIYKGENHSESFYSFTRVR